MKFNSVITTTTLLIPTILAGAPSVNFQGPYAAFVKLVSPFNVAAGNFTGYYYATNFEFVGNDKITGYMGVQPRNEQPNHLVFSIFADDSFSTHPNCHSGADSGSGVSCSLDYPWKFNHNYTTEIVRTHYDPATANTTWTGYLNDLETGDKVEIGSYTVGNTIGALDGSSWVFDEFYGYESYPKDKCIPYAKYIQYPLTYTDNDGKTFKVPPSSGVLNTNVNDPYSYDPCSKKLNEFNQKVTILSSGTVVYENGQDTPH